MPKEPDANPQLPKSPKHPSDDQVMPPFTPGSVPPPEGGLPESPAERVPPPNTLPPKRQP